MPDSIKIELPPQNITVVGAFNPEILVPGWVVKHLPVPKTPALLLDPQTRRVSYQAGDLLWQPERERLVVFGPLDQAGRFVAGFAEALPHTPFSAVGVNIQRKGRVDLTSCGPWRWQIETGQARELLLGDMTEFTFSHIATRDDGVRLTVKIVLPGGGPEALIDFNYHLQVSTGSVDSESAKDRVAEHARRASEFEVDALRISEVLLRG